MNPVDAVPEFGVKRENEERRDGGCGVVFDPATGLFAVGRHHDDGHLRLFSGGVDAGEDLREGILREVREESGLYDFARVEQVAVALSHYRNTLRNVNRVAMATCLLIVLKTASLVPPKLEEHEKFSLDWVTSEALAGHWQARNQNEDFSHWLYFLGKAEARLRELGYGVAAPARAC